MTAAEPYMADIVRLEATCRELALRLEGRPSAAELKAVHLDLSYAQGQIQAALNDAIRAGGATSQIRAAEARFEQFKSAVRQVGLDLRLASPAASQVGLQTALDHALQTLAHLKNVPA